MSTQETMDRMHVAMLAVIKCAANEHNWDDDFTFFSAPSELGPLVKEYHQARKEHLESVRTHLPLANPEA